MRFNNKSFKISTARAIIGYLAGVELNNSGKEIADYLKSNPNKRVIIEGHSDDLGPPDQTYGLSRRRAESVKNYLIEEFGISYSRITAIGFGPDRPLVKGNTREARRLNRRVVVKFVE